jgi:hypothetical protein
MQHVENKELIIKTVEKQLQQEKEEEKEEGTEKGEEEMEEELIDYEDIQDKPWTNRKRRTICLNYKNRLGPKKVGWELK